MKRRFSIHKQSEDRFCKTAAFPPLLLKFIIITVSSPFLHCTHQGVKTALALSSKCSWSLPETIGSANAHTCLVATPWEGKRLLHHQTLRNSSTAADLWFCSQNGIKETSGHSQDLDKLIHQHQLHHLAFVLFVCQEFSKKGYVNLKRPSWLNKD